jgi:fibronectin-binding autotransporter adhesin
MKTQILRLHTLAAFITLGLNAPAATLHWDGNDLGADADGGAGTWGGSGTNWDSLAIAGNSIAWPSPGGSDDDAVFGGSSGTVTLDAAGVTANDITFSTAGYGLSGGRLTLNGTNPTITASADATVGVEIAGTVGLVKAGAGTLTLTQANSYTGTTSIAAGTLALNGGSNRLTTAGTLSFTGTGTLQLGGNSQTLANLSILTASTNTKGTLTGGALTLNGASALTVTPSVTAAGRTAEIDASGLSSLTITKSGQAITVGGFAGAVTTGNSGLLRLSSTSNEITASSINVGTTSGANTSGVINKGELELGAINTINADNWTLGNTRDGGIVRFQSSLTNPTVTLRGQNGTSRVTKITIGQNGAGGTTVGTSSLELAGGSVDLLVTEMVLSRGFSASTTAATPAVNGYFSMGGGSVDATTIWLAKNEAGGRNSTNTAHYYQLAGEVKAGTLVFGEANTLTGTPTLNAQYTLTSGALRATDIKAGTGTFATNSTRRINFNGGTLTHADSSTDLTINGVTGTGGAIGIQLGTDGSPTIETSAGRTVTLGAFTSITGSGSLTKTGSGTLSLGGSASYSGATSILGGSVVAGAANALSATTDLTLANTAGVSLNLNNLNQTIGSLAGGGANGGNIVLGNAVLKTGNANNTTYAGSISGTGSFVKTGAGSLTLSGSTTASLSGLNVSGGTLSLGSGNTLTLTGSAGTGAPDGTTGLIVSRGGTLEINGASITATGGSYVFTAGNTGGGTSQFILNSGTFNGGTKEVLNAYGASGIFTINGGSFTAGEFRISQSATGTVNLNGGTLSVSTLKSANQTEIINFNGGTLKAKANHATFITTGVDQANVLAGGAVIDSNGYTVTIPKELTEDPASPGGGLSKLGEGTLVLGATNTYRGTTNVSAGKLVVNGSIAASALTTVNAAATLGGSGTLGATTVSGTHSPGNSPGVQTFAGDLTYAAGSNLVWELIANTTNGRGTNHDGIDLTGSANLAFTGATTLNLDFAATGSAVDWSDTLWDQAITGTNGWKLFDLSSGSISGIENLSLGTGTWIDAGGKVLDQIRPGFAFSLFSDGGDLYLNYASVSAIPEPGGLAGLAMVFSPLVLMRRRKRTSATTLDQTRG